MKAILTADELPAPADTGPLAIESARWHSGRLLITFAGITDRDQADELRGTWLTLDSAEAGSPEDPDEFGDYELIGLNVVTVSGEPVGQVADVQHHGQDLLVIEPGGVLVPFVRVTPGPLPAFSACAQGPARTTA